MSDFLAFLMAVAAFILYFAPTFVAAKRKHPNGTPIALLNIFLGWTFIGWLAALIWSASAIKTEAQTQPATESKSSNRYGELEKLASLKEKGHISEAEFNREKSKLLGS
ncbi:superinfection immunity protein [Pseudomonas sp. CM27]|uniref:superinfection immunity protein n=1 Tax=Pseudomonas sp. CM27 TaxID=2738452 RepID=UPI001551F6AC|nr:superinfection immunity protein [Pseudomonas sp. CM27]NQD74117.1 superinfection immunity protein [Pseudomonas sp. CM27]